MGHLWFYWDNSKTLLFSYCLDNRKNTTISLSVWNYKLQLQLKIKKRMQNLVCSYLVLRGSGGPLPCSFFTKSSLLRRKTSLSFPSEPLRWRAPVPSWRHIQNFVHIQLKTDKGWIFTMIQWIVNSLFCKDYKQTNHFVFQGHYFMHLIKLHYMENTHATTFSQVLLQIYGNMWIRLSVILKTSCGVDRKIK